MTQGRGNGTSATEGVHARRSSREGDLSVASPACVRWGGEGPTGPEPGVVNVFRYSLSRLVYQQQIAAAGGTPRLDTRTHYWISYVRGARFEAAGAHGIDRPTSRDTACRC
ncbi:unnamed protein product, partial [Ectocarpus sp. 4 AP-2014]